MTDYFAKARQGRVEALDMHRNGAVTFFPEEMSEVLEYDGQQAHMESRHMMARASKPMFVRSASVQQGVQVATPAREDVANAPLLLTEDLAIENVIRLAA